MQAIGQAAPIIRFLFFPAGLFKRKAPQNYFASKPSPTDGRAQRANPGGFMAFALVLFSPPERKENNAEQNSGRVSREKSLFCL